MYVSVFINLIKWFFVNKEQEEMARTKNQYQNKVMVIRNRFSKNFTSLIPGK